MAALQRNHIVNLTLMPSTKLNTLPTHHKTWSYRVWHWLFVVKTKGSSIISAKDAISEICAPNSWIILSAIFNEKERACIASVIGDKKLRWLNINVVSLYGQFVCNLMVHLFNAYGCGLCHLQLLNVTGVIDIVCTIQHLNITKRKSHAGVKAGAPNVHLWKTWPNSCTAQVVLAIRHRALFLAQTIPKKILYIFLRLDFFLRWSYLQQIRTLQVGIDHRKESQIPSDRGGRLGWIWAHL